MVRNAFQTLLLTVLCASAGCHIADQAAGVFTSKNDPNYLSSQNIPALSAVSPDNFSTTKGHTGEVLTLVPLPSTSPGVLSVGQDGRILAWNLTSGQGHEVKHLHATPKVVAFGETKALIAWGDDQGITITCVIGCPQKRTFSRLKVRPTSLAFHDLDTSLLIGGTDGRIYRWRFMEEQDAPTTEELEKVVERYIGHQTVVSGVVGHSVGRAFFSSDWDGGLIGWLSYSSDDHDGDFDRNLFKGRFYTDIPAAMVARRPRDRGISSLTISRDGEFVGVGTEDGHVEVWRVKGFMLSARKQIHQGRVTAVTLSRDGQRIASVGKDSKVHVHSLQADPSFTIAPTALPNLLQELSNHHIPNAQGAAFVTPTLLAVTTKDGNLAEVQLEAQPEIQVTPPPRPTRKVQDTDY